MAKIFISYRRDTSQYKADALYDAIKPYVEDFKTDIFIDVDNIPYGVDFVEHLENRVSQCDILLAVIDSSWVDVVDPETGLKRLDNPDDFVRVEIASALKRGIPVVPLLYDGAPLPLETALSEDIRELVRRNGVQLNRQSFQTDVMRLMKGLGFEPQATAARSPEVAIGTSEPYSRARLLANYAGATSFVAVPMFAALLAGAWLVYLFFEETQAQRISDIDCRAALEGMPLDAVPTECVDEIALLTPSPPIHTGRVNSVTIGAKDHLEANVLAEIMAQKISDAQPDLEVSTRFYIGETSYAWSDLLKGQLDIIPEYSGTLLAVHLDVEPQFIRREHIHATKRLNRLIESNDSQPPVVALGSFGFRNQYVLLADRQFMREHLGEQSSLTLSEFAQMEFRQPIPFASKYEFYHRPDGFPGLAQFYKLRHQIQSVIVPDHLSKYDRLDEGSVLLIDGYSTDFRIDQNNHVVIEDDQGFWPSYWALPIIRKHIFINHPEIVEALAELEGQFTEVEIRALLGALSDANVTPNAIKTGKTYTFTRVIRSWLCNQDLINSCVD